MAGEWGTAPWGGESPTESAGSGTGFWGGGDTLFPLITNFDPICGTESLDVDQTFVFEILDPRTSPTTPGIDLSSCVVSIKIGNQAAETVFTGGVFQTGWTGSSTSVIVGPPEGFEFTIVRDTDYPVSTIITLTITGVNNDGQSSQRVCTFTTVPLSGIADVDLLSLRRVRVNFNTPIKQSSLTSLLTNSNWTVRPIPGNSVHDADNLVIVKQVFAERKYTPTFVILEVSPLIQHQRYEVFSTGFEDIFARAFDGSVLATREARRTKIDSILEGLPPMWEGMRTTDLFWVLAAISEQDEIIGGGQGIILADPLKRNF